MAKAITPLLITGSLILIVLLKTGFVFLLLALLPSIVAYYIDRDEGKPTFKTVLASNLAATLPSLMPMLEAGIHFKHYDATRLMTNPRVWLVVYCGAAAGWCLIYLSRFIARFLLTVLYEYKIASLDRQQNRLLEEWGQEIRQK